MLKIFWKSANPHLLILPGFLRQRLLNKEQKKEIYFWNKAKTFSSFLLILMHFSLMHLLFDKDQTL